MANIKGGLMKRQAQQSVQASTPLKIMIASQDIQKRFNDMLGKKSANFLSSLLTLANDNKMVREADPRTVLAAAATAASLDLPISPSLGKAWIVPYNGVAQFQLGYKGVIELAQRSGRMKSIIMTPVYEGEMEDWNRFTETYTPGEKKSDVVVGYFACFELLNGFRKAAYWSKDDVIKHASKFSKAYKRGTGPWKTDFDAMACKTVLLSIMKTYAPMSIEMQMAIEADNTTKSIEADGNIIDISAEEPDDMDGASEGEEIKEEAAVDMETGEIKEPYGR